MWLMVLHGTGVAVSYPAAVEYDGCYSTRDPAGHHPQIDQAEPERFCNLPEPVSTEEEVPPYKG